VGADGVQGPQGDIGSDGVQGNQGWQGPQGDVGDVGAQGNQGWQGFQGEVGEVGTQGNQGWQGFRGFQGNQGWQGGLGPQGNQGWQGFQGWQGEDLSYSRALFCTSFYTSSTPYVEYNSTTWQAAAEFWYNGTDEVVAQTMNIIASRNGTTGTGTVRVYDVTNNNEIASITITTDTMTIYEDDTLTNLPAAAAIFEIQVIKDAGGSSKVRLHSFRFF